MKYILGVLAVIILTIIAVIVIVGRNPNTPDSTTKTSTTVQKTNLTDYITKNSSVVSQLTGPLKGQEDRRAIRITVSSSNRKVEILKGYEESVEVSRIYQNTQAAYDSFMHAINSAGFLKDRKLAEGSDEKGSCPTGYHYAFELKENSREVSRLWGTSCSANEGNMAGNNQLVRQLFQAQIPDYSEVTTGVTI